ncbi:MAG: T9SS type A sorting domain-containing protein [Bacteroidota bacterium]
MKKSLFFFFVLSTIFLKAQIITTIAGGGSPSTGVGDGGAATSAYLQKPTSIALDAVGNIYIADMYNNRIRKVNVSTGVITTLAGNGVAGFSGDGGRADSASLDNPFGVAIDTYGNLFISDRMNSRIRKVNMSSGIITTVAGNGYTLYAGDGGAATSASINNQNGIAVDAFGNLFIADAGNNRIRKVTASTGIITTVAGNGTYGYSGDGSAATSAKLYSPMGVTIDSYGNLFIADEGNNRIRKVNASTGIITTVAGNGAGYFSGDGGRADTTSLKYPYGVTVDANGNLIIADSWNSRVRKVNASTGIITTIAGNGSNYYSGDGGLATSAVLYFPYCIAFDSNGNLIIADTYNYRIRKVTFPNSGIKEINDKSFSIYPNPANNILFIESSGLTQFESLIIADLSGRIVKNEMLTIATSQSIDISCLEAGIYFVSIHSSEGIINRKIVISH